jgi:hypothetical protein
MAGLDLPSCSMWFRSAVATTGAPVTGMGGWPGTDDRGTGAGQSLYWFMKVTNKSEARDIELTHAYFTGAQNDQLLTRAPLRARPKPDETWEGWLNVASLAGASNVEQSGRALISGKSKPIRSRRNKHVLPIGHVAGP